MIEIEKYAQAAASTARTPPNSPARRAAIELENAARVAAEQFVKGLEAELAEIEAQEPVAWVPVHPRLGELWANATASPDPERLPSYPLRPLYARPLSAIKVGQ